MLVSIIIPAYNVEAYISRGIKSCLEQTYRNIEIVIIDDGSSDDTWKIIQVFQKEDGRIKAVRQKNAGVSAARNHGLRVATGNYVLFLDSDDWLELDTVEKLLQCIRTNNNHLICTECFFVQDREGILLREQQGKNSEEVRIDREDALLTFGKSNAYKLQSSCYKLFNKGIIDKYSIYFEEGIYHGEDGLFTFEYLKHMKGLYYYPYPLWNILERVGSATMSPYNSKWLTAITAIEKMLLYTDNSVILEKRLKAYKAERALWLLIDCCRIDNPPKTDIILLRKVLKDNIKYLFEEGKVIKREIQYYILEYLPVSIIKLLLRIKSRW